MLFRKNHNRACAYCAHGTATGDGQILCAKKGIKNDTDACRRFSYDPCKRIPPQEKPLDFSRYKDEDFTL